MEIPFGTKKREGQLPKPQWMLDLFAGSYAVYQGWCPGSIDGRIDIYVKRANSNTIETIHDVPGGPYGALQFIPSVNKWSNPTGTWALLGGPEGVPTVAQKLLGIMPEIFQRMAESTKHASDIEAKNRLMQKTASRTAEEQAEALSEQTKKLTAAAKPPWFDPQKRGSDTSLTK